MSGAGLRAKSILKEATPSVIALAVGFFAASLLLEFSGSNPLTVFRQMFAGALFTSAGQSYVVSYSSTLILGALAFIIPGKAGIWNVGGQGQIYLGGITAALIAVFLPLPPVVWPLVAIAGACLGGAVWAVIPGALEAYRNASAIVTTLMLNFVGSIFASEIFYDVIGPRVGQTVYTYSNVEFKGPVVIPSLPYFTASVMILVAVALAVGTAYFLSRTTLGYKIRAAGLGPRPAEAKGINPRTMKVAAMAIGGLFAGLAGAGDVLGIGHACAAHACYYELFAEGAFGGEGFAGLTVALIALSSPIGSIFAALFFGTLVSGSSYIVTSTTPVQAYVPQAMEGLIIIFMAMPALSKMLMNYRRRRRWT